MVAREFTVLRERLVQLLCYASVAGQLGNLPKDPAARIQSREDISSGAPEFQRHLRRNRRSPHRRLSVPMIFFIR